MDTISFEIYVMDILEDKGIESAAEMEWIMGVLHEAIENAAIDYAEGEGIENYSPII